MTDFMEFDSRDFYPGENKELTSLQKSMTFLCRSGVVNMLKPLKNLRLCGSLSIHYLQNVKSKTEAAEATLNKKKNLNELTFSWSRIVGYDVCEEVLQGLEPHPNLETLNLIGYRGLKFPNWMINENWLPGLRTLQLSYCMGIEEVPYLPPRLENLSVTACQRLMQLPSIMNTLRTLKLSRCLKLMPPSMSKKTLRLHHIEILGCGRDESQFFSDLPFLTNLEYLKLEGFSNLETFPNLSPTVTTLQIVDFPKLTSLGNLQYYTALETLKIIKCPMLWINIFSLVAGVAEYDIAKCLPCSIKYLHLDGSGRPFPPLLEENLHHIFSLKSLVLEGFTALSSLEKLSSLLSLSIKDCPDVELLPSLPISLTSLDVQKCPDIELLPNLPISLESLEVFLCPNLKVKYEEGGQLHNTISHIPRLYFH